VNLSIDIDQSKDRWRSSYHLNVVYAFVGIGTFVEMVADCVLFPSIARTPVLLEIGQ